MEGKELCSQRLVRARALMHHHGLDWLVVGPSADLLYLVGAHSRPSERLAALLLPQEGPAHVVVPAFEAATLPPLPDEVRVTAWGETDNPARLAATLLATGVGGQPGGAQCTVGVSDRLWSVFLLRLQAELPRAAFTGAGSVLGAIRLLKSEEELALLAQSGKRADDVFGDIVRRPFAGRSELEVAEEIASLLKARGLRVADLPIVASGPNSASPHHHTGERRIEPGDLVVLDFGGTFRGYFSDITRTVSVGAPPEPGSEQERVYNLVRRGQEAAVQAGRPGMKCESLDAVARDIFIQEGYGEYFSHRLGHGIGLDIHEPPYLVKGNGTELQAGMAFTIEPGLYLPGKFGVRIEDTVYMGANGVERVNNADRGIVVVS